MIIKVQHWIYYNTKENQILLLVCNKALKDYYTLYFFCAPRFFWYSLFLDYTKNQQSTKSFQDFKKNFKYFQIGLVNITFPIYSFKNKLFIKRKLIKNESI